MSLRSLPPFSDLKAFVAHLERSGQLMRVSEPVSLVHEMTEVHRRILRAGGPALLFEQAIMADGRISDIPVLVNLFGTSERVAMGLGVTPDGLDCLAESMAWLRQPEAPDGFRDAFRRWPLLRAALATRSVAARSAPAQEIIHQGDRVDLSALPIQTCWPGEPAPLITWPLVVTSPPGDYAPARANLGV